MVGAGTLLDGAAVQADENPWSFRMECETLSPTALALKLNSRLEGLGPGMREYCLPW